MTDEKLLCGLGKKNLGYIDKAITLYTPYVSTVVYGVSSGKLQKEDMEEIIADVFISLWKNAGYIDLSKGSIRSYIGAIAKNNTLKRLKEKETLPLDENMACEFSQRDFSEDVLWQAVMELGEPDNEIFVRHYKYGEKLREVADHMKINLSTVKIKLLRGREKLRKILEREGF